MSMSGPDKHPLQGELSPLGLCAHIDGQTTPSGLFPSRPLPIQLKV